MARSENSAAVARFLTLAVIVLVVLGLYLAQEVLIPLALAILLSFMLAPLVRRVERIGLWRVPAVLLVTVLAFSVVVGLGYVLAGQLVELGDRLPEYRQGIRERVTAIRASAGSALGRASKNLQDISQELASTQTAPATVPAVAAPATRPPVPVQVVAPPQSPFEFVHGMIGSVLSPVLTAGIVMVFVLFILVQREDLRDRLIRLAGEERVDVTTQALDDTARRISRYLLAMAIINATFATLAAVGLWLIGLPNALLWGLLAGALRFVPYIGIWIGMALPIALSLAVFPEGWLAPLAVVALFATLELLVANVVEPLVYGGSTGISPLAVLVAAVFWAWLWGPVGLLLSTPLTVCMVVLGKYAPSLSFLTVLLGDQPVLDPSVRLYQRLLAGDQEEAEDLAEEHLADSSLVKVYDDLLVPCLHLAEMDRHRGRLENGRVAALYQDVREIAEVLRDQQSRDGDGTPEKVEPAGGQQADLPERALHALCLPVRDEADEMVADMLCQTLTDAGIESRTLPSSMLASEMVEQVAGSEAKIVCISALPPEAMAKARYVCKRLRARLPHVKVVVGYWDCQADPVRVRQRLLNAGADHVVSDMSQLLQVVRPSLAARAVPATQNDRTED